MQNIKQQLPMIATYSRIFAGLPFILFIYLGEPWSVWPAAWIFMIGSFTDYLDGYWARKYNCESPMGKFMDPIADKILVLCALIMLLEMQRLPALLVIVLIARDIFIGGIRSVAATNNVIIAAKPFGKWKTAFQMLGIPCLIIYRPEYFWDLPIREIGMFCLWASVFLSLISGVQYTWGYYAGRK